MSEPYQLVDVGDRRVLTVGGQDYPTYYSKRVVQMLIERKGPERAKLYFPFKEERARKFLSPLFRHLGTRGVTGLSVLEVGCSFGHITEYLNEQPEVAQIASFDTDPAFIEIVRTKVEEMRLDKVSAVKLLSNDETRRLPWSDGAFDLVLAVGVVEHLPERHRRAQVDEYFRVLAPGGHIAILDTPNRWFPYESHSVRLLGVQWLPPWLAYRYARAFGRNRIYAKITYEAFQADDGAGWRNSTFDECLPSSGLRGLEDLTEAAGYGWRFFRDTARSRTARALLPLFAVSVVLLRGLGWPPSLCLPYLNLLFRKLLVPNSDA